MNNEQYRTGLRKPPINPSPPKKAMKTRAELVEAFALQLIPTFASAHAEMVAQGMYTSEQWAEQVIQIADDLTTAYLAKVTEAVK